MNSLLNQSSILVLAPHTDDGEFGCGGTIARFLEAGVKVHYVAFSSCDESLPGALPAGTLKDEMYKATTKLGISRDSVTLFNFRVRKFPELRQDILEEMVKLSRSLKPSLVLLPSTHDTHQDHNTIAQEGFRAFKSTSILGYEVPWNNLTFTTNAFVHLEERHLQAKIESIQCYLSQTERVYSRPESIRSLAVTRGVQIGAPYAEAFEVIRWIVR